MRIHERFRDALRPKGRRATEPLGLHERGLHKLPRALPRGAIAKCSQRQFDFRQQANALADWL